MAEKLRAVDYLKANNSPEPKNKKTVIVSRKKSDPTDFEFCIKRKYMTHIEGDYYECYKIVASNKNLHIIENKKLNK